ncbi:MAG: hypothetical protein KAY37_00630 [Phycisphaerae bacterium]|nr:hypothetical protein [Phycisphaerae bacterium]
MATAENTPGEAGNARKNCRNCGHDLGTLGDQDCCPECGFPVLASLSSPDAEGVIDQHGVVAGDTTCHKCGYNLRGLQREGRCPECATPIKLSIRQDFLCFAEPGYVRKLARGNRFILWGLWIVVFTWIVAVVMSLLAVWFVIAGGDSTHAKVIKHVLFALTAAGTIIGSLMFLWGLWLFTCAEPSIYDTSRRDTARRFVRFYMLVAVLGLALTYIVAELVPPMRLMAVFKLFSICFSVLGVIGSAAYFMYISGMTRRIPNEQFAKRARDLAKNMAITIGLLALVSIVGTVARWGPVLVAPAGPAPSPTTSAATTAPAGFGTFSTWSTVQSCFTGILYLVLLVLLSRTERLHRHLRKPLNQQATLAAQHWQSAIPSTPA